MQKLSSSSLSPPSDRPAVEEGGGSSLSVPVYLLYQSVVLLGWEDEGMEGEATEGCKLIRFLSFHAPLPVLLLSNPGGQRCAAQRLASQTQWGNNWYKQHSLLKLYQSFQVTLSLLSGTDFTLIQKLFLHCSFLFHPFVPSSGFSEAFLSLSLHAVSLKLSAPLSPHS